MEPFLDVKFDKSTSIHFASKLGLTLTSLAQKASSQHNTDEEDPTFRKSVTLVLHFTSTVSDAQPLECGRRLPLCCESHTRVACSSNLRVSPFGVADPR